MSYFLLKMVVDAVVVFVAVTIADYDCCSNNNSNNNSNNSNNKKTTTAAATTAISNQQSGLETPDVKARTSVVVSASGTTA